MWFNKRLIKGGLVLKKVLDHCYTVAEYTIFNSFLSNTNISLFCHEDTKSSFRGKFIHSYFATKCKNIVLWQNKKEPWLEAGGDYTDL